MYCFYIIEQVDDHNHSKANIRPVQDRTPYALAISIFILKTILK